MKAFVYPRYGGIKAFELREIPKPVPGDNELLIKVHAVSINDWDWGIMDGSSLFTRLTSGFSKPKRQVLGSDIAGTIEAVGRNVQEFKTGDEVYGDLSGQWGGFAEYVCAPAKSLAKKPATMSFEQAAAIPQAAMLAVQGLIDVGKIKKGQKLLLNGAGGGVGTFGLQIAKLYDAEVTVVDSADKLDMLRALGAVHTIDYKKEDFTKSRTRYDLILDTKTNRSPLSYLKALNHNGTYVTVGGSLSKLLQFLFLKPFISLFTSKQIKIVMLKPNKDLAYMNEMFLAGKVKPIIDGHFSFNELPKAFEVYSIAGHKGKLVITIAETNA